MKKKFVCVVLTLLLGACLFFACKAQTSQEKGFVIGEEILFENGRSFELPGIAYVSGEGNVVDTFTITKAKMVAQEEYKIDDRDNWPYSDQFLFSYRYRIFVTGYAPEKCIGKEFDYTLRFRTCPFNGVEYLPSANYEAKEVGPDGSFEFSVDVYMPDPVEKVIPVRLYCLS